MLTVLNCKPKGVQKDALVAASAIFDGLLLLVGAWFLARWTLGQFHSLGSLAFLPTLFVVTPVAAFATGMYARVAASYWFNCIDDGKRVRTIAALIAAAAVLAACLAAL